MTSDEQALLLAIVANPGEDTPRLVYADWLQENDDPLRAEFIRNQIALSRAEMPDEQRAYELTCNQLRREGMRTNSDYWLSSQSGPVYRYALTPACKRHIRINLHSRGFAECIEVQDIDQAERHTDILSAAASALLYTPARTISLYTLPDNAAISFDALCEVIESIENSSTQNLQIISSRNPEHGGCRQSVTADMIDRLGQARFFANVASLTLIGRVEPDALSCIKGNCLRRLSSLNLALHGGDANYTGCADTLQLLEGLGAARRRIQSLSISNSEVNLTSGVVRRVSSDFPNLRNLRLSHLPGSGDLGSIADAPSLCNLESIYIGYGFNECTENDWLRFFRSPNLTHLKEIGFSIPITADRFQRLFTEELIDATRTNRPEPLPALQAVRVGDPGAWRYGLGKIYYLDRGADHRAPQWTCGNERGGRA